MSYVNLQQTTRVAIPMYDSLFRETWITFQKYYKEYGEEDYRSALFGTYVSTLLWTLVQLENFSNHVPDPIIRKRFDNLKPSSMGQALFQYDTINRQCYVMSTMALVEDFVNEVCKSCFKTTFRTYKLSLDEIVKSFFSNDQNKLLRLYSLYLVRNTLHNNGFIKVLGNDFDLVIDGKTISFKKNQQFMFGGWDNLYLLSKSLFQIIVELIEHQDMRNIPKITHTNLLESQSGVIMNNLGSQLKL